MTETSPARPLRHSVSGEGSTIVLLHPIAMRLEFWAPVATRLARTHRVVSLDLRGHGENPPSTGDFTIADLAADVIALVAELGIARAVFAGCSLGGMVAQAVALAAPERVAGLLLANTTDHMTGQSRAVMLERARNAERGLETTVESDLQRWLTPAFRAAHPEMAEQVRRWVLANDKATIARGWRAIAGLDHAGAVGRIGCPVTVLTGSLDPASPPAGARAMAERFPAGRYVALTETGHFSPLERPAQFATAITALTKPD